MQSIKQLSDKVIFPAPETSYTSVSAANHVIYIPRTIAADVDIKLDRIENGDLNYFEETEDPLMSLKMKKRDIDGDLESQIKELEEFDQYIPVLYLPYEQGATDKLCIYFHGNCEDIGSSFECLDKFGKELHMHMMAIEYPGYGLYKQSKPSELKIKEDCESIYDYLTQVCGVQETNIVLWGRSLGTGPCSYLASIRQPHSILLMSAFTSIRDTAKDVLGKFGFLNTLVDDIFPNLKHIAAVRCPVFLMHGVKDTLIPYTHSQKLKEACQQYCYFNLVAEMDHNAFNLTQDLVAPFLRFMGKIEHKPREPDPCRKYTLVQCDSGVRTQNKYDRSSVIYQGTNWELDLDPGLFEAPPQILKLQWLLKKKEKWSADVAV